MAACRRAENRHLREGNSSIRRHFGKRGSRKGSEKDGELWLGADIRILPCIFFADDKGIRSPPMCVGKRLAQAEEREDPCDDAAS